METLGARLNLESTGHIRWTLGGLSELEVLNRQLKALSSMSPNFLPTSSYQTLP